MTYEIAIAYDGGINAATDQKLRAIAAAARVEITGTDVILGGGTRYIDFGTDAKSHALMVAKQMVPLVKMVRVRELISGAAPRVIFDSRNGVTAPRPD